MTKHTFVVTAELPDPITTNRAENHPAPPSTMPPQDYLRISLERGFKHTVGGGAVEQVAETKSDPLLLTALNALRLAEPFLYDGEARTAVINTITELNGRVKTDSGYTGHGDHDWDSHIAG